MNDLSRVAPPTAVATRRRTPRIGVDGVDVRIASISTPLKLVDLSWGGFCVETPYSLRVDAVYAFEFTPSSGQTMPLEARVIHCRRKMTDDGSEQYISGCEFVHRPDSSTDRLIDTLIDAAIDSITFQKD